MSDLKLLDIYVKDFKNSEAFGAFDRDMVTAGLLTEVKKELPKHSVKLGYTVMWDENAHTAVVYSDSSIELSSKLEKVLKKHKFEKEQSQQEGMVYYLGELAKSYGLHMYFARGIKTHPDRGINAPWYAGLCNQALIVRLEDNVAPDKLLQAMNEYFSEGYDSHSYFYQIPCTTSVLYCDNVRRIAGESSSRYTVPELRHAYKLKNSIEKIVKELGEHKAFIKLHDNITEFNDFTIRGLWK